MIRAVERVIRYLDLLGKIFADRSASPLDFRLGSIPNSLRRRGLLSHVKAFRLFYDGDPFERLFESTFITGL